MNRAFQSSRVKPTATTRTTGYRTEFMAALSQACAHFVKQFSREWTGTHAGCIGFNDTQDVIQHLRTYACTGRSSTCQAVGGSYKRISTIVDIQQRTLRAFKQQAFAFAVFLVQNTGNISNHRRNARRNFFNDRHHIFNFYRLGIVQVLQLNIVISQNSFQFFNQFFRVQQVHHANRTTGNFIFIGWADAATGCTNFAFTAGSFACLVKRNVVRQNQWTGRRNFQTAFDVFHTGSVQFIDFTQQCFRRNDNT